MPPAMPPTMVTGCDQASELAAGIGFLFRPPCPLDAVRVSREAHPDHTEGPSRAWASTTT
jgi:hypothetical protein